MHNHYACKPCNLFYVTATGGRTTQSRARSDLHAASGAQSSRTPVPAVRRRSDRSRRWFRVDRPEWKNLIETNRKRSDPKAKSPSRNERGRSDRINVFRMHEQRGLSGTLGQVRIRSVRRPVTGCSAWINVRFLIFQRRPRHREFDYVCSVFPDCLAWVHIHGEMRYQKTEHQCQVRNGLNVNEKVPTPSQVEYLIDLLLLLLVIFIVFFFYLF